MKKRARPVPEYRLRNRLRMRRLVTIRVVNNVVDAVVEQLRGQSGEVWLALRASTKGSAA